MIHTDHDMWIEPPYGCRHRRENESIKQIILHWSGGEGPTSQVARTLKNRRLSYHYIIDKEGDITQLVCDRHAAFHAGPANGNSLGICLVNAGKLNVPSKRNVTRSIVHGKTLRLLDFFPEQFDSLCWLLDHLVDAYCLSSDVMTMPTRASDRKEFCGIMAHYNWTLRKIDPGTKLMKDLAEKW